MCIRDSRKRKEGYLGLNPNYQKIPLLLYKAKWGQNQLKIAILGPKKPSIKPKIGQNMYLGDFNEF